MPRPSRVLLLLPACAEPRAKWKRSQAGGQSDCLAKNYEPLSYVSVWSLHESLFISFIDVNLNQPRLKDAGEWIGRCNKVFEKTLCHLSGSSEFTTVDCVRHTDPRSGHRL